MKDKTARASVLAVDVSRPPTSRCWSGCREEEDKRLALSSQLLFASSQTLLGGSKMIALLDSVYSMIIKHAGIGTGCFSVLSLGQCWFLNNRKDLNCKQMDYYPGLSCCE